MADRTNRRDALIEAAAELFQQQGYNATSVRQIADAVGVTEAALYYHFKDGKRELLQAVLEAFTPHIVFMQDHAAHRPTLHDFILQFLRDQDNDYNRNNIGRLRWLIGEYPNLSADEQAIFQDKALETHQQLTASIRRYVADDEKARRMAWILLATLVGYGQLFLNLGLSAMEPDFAGDETMRLLALMFACFADK